MKFANFVAIDLGASNGRVFNASWNGKTFNLRELHRFANSSVDVLGRLHWDVLRLWSEIKNGLSSYSREYQSIPAGIGVDAWGVDFALLDAEGSLLGNPHTYRDRRTEGIPASVFAQIPEQAIFQETGIQSCPINTVFQIFSMVQNRDPQLEAAATMLMIPDLFSFWLSGAKSIEYTIGSTSQMLRTKEPEWAHDLLTRLRIPSHFLPSVIKPGSALGPLRREIARETNLSAATSVLAVAAHDTASSVAAITGMDSDSVFISSGTWSLMGMEISEPICTPQACQLGFSNERGVGGAVLLLCNITGLWLLQECMRQWRIEGNPYSWTGLLKIAEKSEPFRSLIVPDSPEFVAPKNMLLAIRNFCRRTKQLLPDSPGAFARCCIESLCLRYRQVLDSLVELTHQQLSIIRVAGGGALNRMLCQFTANATNRSVITGPTEASVLGNVLVQAIATGHIKNLNEGREAVALSVRQSIFEPRAVDSWEQAFELFQKLVAGSPLTHLVLLAGMLYGVPTSLRA
jgi:rhamnulokinase